MFSHVGTNFLLLKFPTQWKPMDIELIPTGATACRGSRRARRTGTKTCGGRAAKSTRSRVSRSDRGKEDKTHNIRRIHTCLPYTSLETTSYSDRKEPQHARLHH